MAGGSEADTAEGRRSPVEASRDREQGRQQAGYMLTCEGPCGRERRGFEQEEREAGKQGTDRRVQGGGWQQPYPHPLCDLGGSGAIPRGPGAASPCSLLAENQACREGQ